MKYKFRFIFLISSSLVFLTLTSSVRAQIAGCTCNCEARFDPQWDEEYHGSCVNPGEIVWRGCNGAYAYLEWFTEWDSCTINPVMIGECNSVEEGSCEIGSSICHTHYCPSGGTERDECCIWISHWDGLSGCVCDMYCGNWDDDDDACVQCNPTTSTTTTTTLQCCCDNAGCGVNGGSCCWASSCSSPYSHPCTPLDCSGMPNCPAATTTTISTTTTTTGNFIEYSVIGNFSGIYFPGTESGDGLCEAACGADPPCDELSPDSGVDCWHVDGIKGVCQDCVCKKKDKCESDDDCYPGSEDDPGYICDPDSEQCVTCNRWHEEYLSSDIPNDKCESNDTGTRFLKGIRRSCCTADPECDEIEPGGEVDGGYCTEFCEFIPTSTCWNEGQSLSQIGLSTGTGKPMKVRLWNQDDIGYMWKCGGYDSKGNCLLPTQLGSLEVLCSDTGDQDIDWDVNEVQGIRFYIKDNSCEDQSYSFQMKNAGGGVLFKQSVGCGACGFPDCPGSGWGECGRMIMDNMFVPSTEKIHYARCWDNDDECKIFVDGDEKASIICCGQDTGEVDVDHYMSAGQWHRITIENYQRGPDSSKECKIDNCEGCDNPYSHQMSVKDSGGGVIWESHSGTMTGGEGNPYTDFSSCCGSRYIVNLFWCKGCIDGDDCRDYGDTWSSDEKECVCNGDGTVTCTGLTLTQGLFLKTLNAIKRLW